MAMKRALLLAVVLLALVLFGVSCGSSSEVTESDVASLLDQRAVISGAICAKEDGRKFVCQVHVEGEPVVLKVTMPESGTDLVITGCKQEPTIYKVCSSLP